MQSALCILVPLAVTGMLGSFVRLGYFGFALMAPLLALVFIPRQFWGWLAAYILAFLVGVIGEPFLTLSPRLPEWLVLLWFTSAILVSGLMALLMIWYLLQQRNQALAQLAEEQERTETLLVNMLPEQIVQRLKMTPQSGRQIIADQTDETRILFADVVNFTLLFAQISPQELVGLLDRLFTRFDALTDRYGLGKIKTVGDCYMAAAGVPGAQPEHAIAIARLAL
ncbi:MAG: hypothetical protein JW862_12950, partial [Anaerolineales bacterium]|nr:hypothetical protein [Anaerolineales bacterium]